VGTAIAAIALIGGDAIALAAKTEGGNGIGHAQAKQVAAEHRLDRWARARGVIAVGEIHEAGGHGHGRAGCWQY
jgi:hypothetical protein